jgi:arylsulfatase A-like enzyme
MDTKLLLLAGLAAMARPVAAQPVAERPNIIYIYADDLGFGELGCYGQRLIRTPHLDRMAREGMRFTQHYSGAPVCAPSRCMLMTGRHSGHAYIRGNYEMGGFEDEKEGGQMPLHENAYTVARMLKERGYATGLVGKWGMGVTGTTGSPLKHGFDHYYGYLDQKQAHNHYPTHLWEDDRRVPLRNAWVDVHQKLDPVTATAADYARFSGTDYAPQRMGDKALAFIEANHRRKPFFLYFAITLPHLSLQVPDSFLHRYDGVFAEQPYPGGKSYAPVQRPLSAYAAMITFLDAQVGRILDRIKALGIERNTLVMFSSDNGNTFDIGGVQPEFFRGNGGLRGLKMDLYEGGIRVPFLARWPGRIAANSVTEHVSTQYDMMATLSDITGGTVADTDGISLWPLLSGHPERQQRHGFLYFEYPEKGGQVAVRIGDWKGVRRDVRKNPNAPWELYDLATDTAERRDVAAANPGILARMDAIVRREHAHPHLMEWEFLDPKK